MVILLVFVVLFLLGGGYNAFTGSVYDVIYDVVFAAILLFIYVFFKREKKKSQDILQWIEQNKGQITNTRGLTYLNGHYIDGYTELIQYFACISLLLFTIKVPSRYFVKGTVSSKMALIIYTMITALLGWWAFPKGPIYTVQIIFKNVTGRNTVEVRKLIEEEVVSDW